MKYDFHVHSCLSPCGNNDMTPNNIAGMAMLNGVGAIALTDHNSSLNCPAFYKCCENNGIIPIAGMELTTAEDVHIVCLFPELDGALEFSDYVAAHRMKIKNRVDIFGDQLVLDENDEQIGTVDELLISASDLDISGAYETVTRLGGAAFPAHVDKESNGIINILGDFPPEPGFMTAEFHDAGNEDEYVKKYPNLAGKRFLFDSDAHYLHQMPLEPHELEIDDGGSPDDVRRRIIAYLRGK